MIVAWLNSQLKVPIAGRGYRFCAFAPDTTGEQLGSTLRANCRVSALLPFAVPIALAGQLVRIWMFGFRERNAVGPSKTRQA